MRHLHTLVCVGFVAIASMGFSGGLTASVGDKVILLEDADLPAKLWANDNSSGIAVAIRLGAATPVTANVIEDALRSDFEKHGVSRIKFFWEKGGNGGSSVVYVTRNHAWGPFGLADSRKKVAEAAAQLRFEVKRGLD